jgi:hypothetical protein
MPVIGPLAAASKETDAIKHMPEPLGSGLRSLKALFALNPLSWVSDVKFGAQADEVGVSVIFEAHDCGGQRRCENNEHS